MLLASSNEKFAVSNEFLVITFLADECLLTLASGPLLFRSEYGFTAEGLFGVSAMLFLL